ncbi:MAG TPA: radical SAM protein [Anaerolineae bacterium]|nr:radical SAM protein [Anaerolineae bacterium]
MEFHPSDRCNLGCQGCTYGHDSPVTRPVPISFPLHDIGRIAHLRPESINISGGGEPTLYTNGEYAFQEMVEQVSDTNPEVVLSLVTNGTLRPRGDWPNRMAWIRLSLDAATEETYRVFRGKAMFTKVLENFLDYLDFDVPYVGISFLYAKTNVHEYAQVAHDIHQLVQEHKPDKLPKVNIQYRPLRRDPRDYQKPFDLAVSEEDIHRTVSAVVQLAQSSLKMERFLREQTNVTAILGGNSHPPYEFARCYYSQIFRIVRANGELRPCFIRVIEPDFVLGNILNDPLEKIALNALYIAARRKPDCDAHGCRQCHVNFIMEMGLQKQMAPSSSPEVLADPMF